MLNKFTCHSMILSFVRRRIRLTDACLLLFMIILMMQSVYNLFFRELNGLEGAGAIDVIIRTTTAAIYGYFIGAGFLRDEQILEYNHPFSSGKMIIPAQSRSYLI